MNGKLIGIFVCTLMIASTVVSADVIKIENKTDNDVFESPTMSTLGETYLYPPWAHAGWCNIVKNEGIAGADCDNSGDEYEGFVYGSVWAGPGVGGANVNAHYYHQNPHPYHEVPCTGHYDIKLTYSYWGDFEGHVFILPDPADWAELVVDVKISFLLYVDSDTPQNYKKEIVLEENSYNQQGDWFKNWDDTITISFDDIYIKENTEILVNAQLDINKLCAGAALVANWAGGAVALNGKLRQIKIVDSCPSNPPSTPARPSGKRNGGIDTLYTYTTSATDPDNDNVYYMWDWDANGGHDYSNWLGPYPSGQQISAKHSWEEQGEYYVRVKAKDEYDKESPWSSSLSVSIPKSKNLDSVLGLFSRFTNLFPVLTSMLQNML